MILPQPQKRKKKRKIICEIDRKKIDFSLPCYVLPKKFKKKDISGSKNDQNN